MRQKKVKEFFDDLLKVGLFFTNIILFRDTGIIYAESLKKKRIASKSQKKRNGNNQGSD